MKTETEILFTDFVLSFKTPFSGHILISQVAIDFNSIHEFLEWCNWIVKCDLNSWLNVSANSKQVNLNHRLSILVDKTLPPSLAYMLVHPKQEFSLDNFEKNTVQIHWNKYRVVKRGIPEIPPMWSPVLLSIRTIGPFNAEQSPLTDTERSIRFVLVVWPNQTFTLHGLMMASFL